MKNPSAFEGKRLANSPLEKSKIIPIGLVSKGVFNEKETRVNGWGREEMATACQTGAEWRDDDIVVLSKAWDSDEQPVCVEGSAQQGEVAVFAEKETRILRLDFCNARKREWCERFLDETRQWC